MGYCRTRALSHYYNRYCEGHVCAGNILTLCLLTEGLNFRASFLVAAHLPLLVGGLGSAALI